jgi:gas vesicle protein
MNSRKTLFAILGGVAITTVIGFLLAPYQDKSKRKKIVDKTKDYAENAEETIKDSVSNVKSRVKKISGDAERMINEGGSAK